MAPLVKFLLKYSTTDGATIQYDKPCKYGLLIAALVIMLITVNINMNIM